MDVHTASHPGYSCSHSVCALHEDRYRHINSNEHRHRYISVWVCAKHLVWSGITGIGRHLKNTLLAISCLIRSLDTHTNTILLMLTDGISYSVSSLIWQIRNDILWLDMFSHFHANRCIYIWMLDRVKVCVFAPVCISIDLHNPIIKIVGMYSVGGWSCNHKQTDLQ